MPTEFDAALLKKLTSEGRVYINYPRESKINREAYKCEALAYVRRQAARIGVVLLDANLGGIDTVRLLGALRHAAPNAKIVLSSGSREEDLRELFASQPFDAFLAKPYTMVELKAALARGAPKTAT